MIKRKPNQKRAVSFLLTAALLWVLCSCAYADQHFEIECVFSEQLCGASVTADLYEQNNETVFVSSLFPDVAAVFSSQESIPVMLHDVLGTLEEEPINVISDIEHIINTWLEKQESETFSGEYTGDIFQSSEYVEICTFSLSAFSEYLENTVKEKRDISEEKLYYGSTLFAGFISREIRKTSNGTDCIIQSKCFDNGKYYTFMLLTQNEPILTISADCSQEMKRHYVIGCKSENKYYYRDIQCEFTENGFNIENNLIIGKSTYYNLSKKRPLFSETVSVENDKNNHISWNSVLKSSKLSDILKTSGTIEKDAEGYKTISADISLQDHPELNMTIHVFMEPTGRRVSFGDKSIKKYIDPNEAEEIDTAVYSGALQLAAVLIPSLPADFQNLLIGLLMK